MWSIGVITYILLTGIPPFQGESMTDIYNEIMRGQLIFDEEDWVEITPQAKEFVTKLVEPNVEKRLTPNQALKHPWIKDSGSTEIEINGKLLERLAHSKSPSELKKEIMLVLINLSDSGNLSKWNECFESLDIEGSGTIDVKEIIKKLKENKSCCSILKKLEHLVEHDKDAKIDYFDFLIRIIDVNKDIKETDIEKAFQQLDSDDCGKITEG